MKKKFIVTMVIIILAILLIPKPMHLNDGGTIEYKSLTYKISKVHRSTGDLEIPYKTGIIIEVFGIEVFNNVK